MKGFARGSKKKMSQQTFSIIAVETFINIYIFFNSTQKLPIQQPTYRQLFTIDYADSSASPMMNIYRRRRVRTA
jgi:hypothetical protein